MYLIFGTFLTLALLCCCPYLFMEAAAGNTFKSLHSNHSITVANITSKPKVNTISPTTFHNKAPELVLFNDSRATDNRKTNLDKVNAFQQLNQMKQIERAKNVKVQGKAAMTNTNNKPQATTAKPQLNATSVKQLFGDQTSSSLLRPSFLKDLLGSRKAMAAGNGQSGEGEEEEEEVTQTIELPMTKKEQRLLAQKQQQQVGIRSSASQPGLTTHQMRQLPLMYAASIHNSPQHRVPKEVQPKPEASLQLTSTEMNSILNDREAPEFYREREFNGEGVMVGEEQPRLRTSASTGMAGFGGGSFESGGMSGFGGDSFGQQRLLQAGSEDQSGFNHRFGSQGFGGGDELSGMGPGHAGRLMQSPAEYSEMGPSGYGSYGGDVGPNSGLLRAGSGEFSADNSEGASFDGGFGSSGMGGSSGYPNSPMLDRHASELYGAGGGGAVGAGMSGNQFDFGPQSNGMFSGYNPNRFAASQIRYTGAGSDEYSNRFGSAFNQRGFSNQNNMMLRGHSMLSNSMQDSGRMGASELGGSGNFGGDMGAGGGVEFSSGGGGGSSGGGNKLMPLSPVIPVAEDVSSSNYREVSSSSDQQLPDRFRQAAPQVHEGLEDDPSDSSDPSESDSSSGQQFEAANQADGAEGNMGMGGGVVGDESTTSSNYEMQARAAKADHANEQANLVLNVPPPNIDNSLHNTNGHRNMAVEFSRVGPAGYLSPGHSSQESAGSGASGPQYKLRQKILKKTSGFLNQQSSQDRPEYDPAENPAHTGKYIID